MRFEMELFHFTFPQPWDDDELAYSQAGYLSLLCFVHLQSMVGGLGEREGDLGIANAKVPSREKWRHLGEPNFLSNSHAYYFLRKRSLSFGSLIWNKQNDLCCLHRHTLCYRLSAQQGWQCKLTLHLTPWLSQRWQKGNSCPSRGCRASWTMGGSCVTKGFCSSWPGGWNMNYFFLAFVSAPEGE